MFGLLLYHIVNFLIQWLNKLSFVINLNATYIPLNVFFVKQHFVFLNKNFSLFINIRFFLVSDFCDNLQLPVYKLTH